MAPCTVTRRRCRRRREGERGLKEGRFRLRSAAARRSCALLHVRPSARPCAGFNHRPCRPDGAQAAAADDVKLGGLVVRSSSKVGQADDAAPSAAPYVLQGTRVRTKLHTHSPPLLPPRQFTFPQSRRRFLRL